MKKYDCVIIGGGLAGLSLAILLKKKGFDTILFERKKFPFHRVCGEYISMEAWEFIQGLGIPLDSFNLPKINQLHVSSNSGNLLKSTLSMGGFGISRFKIDNLLYEKAKNMGVEIIEEQAVHSIVYENEEFFVSSQKLKVCGRIAIGGFGKKSNLDNVLNRKYLSNKNQLLKNFIAVKYHIKAESPNHLIELHTFKDGYCGVSKIENDQHCLCYLTTAQNLKNSNNNIEEMENTILSSNPFLKSYFKNSEKLYKKPLVISQIDFSKKNLMEKNILMVGDSAGLIAPLCGNGMSMAFKGSKILSEWLDLFFSKKIDKETLFINYKKEWEHAFGWRLRVGRGLQLILKNTKHINRAIYLLNKAPFITKKLISLTHGKKI